MGVEEKRIFILNSEDYGVIIRYVENGFIAQDNEGNWYVFKNSKQDEEEGSYIDSMQDLIYFLLEYFNINPTRYAKRRLFPHIEVGDKYKPKENEKIEKEYYYVVKEKL